MNNMIKTRRRERAKEAALIEQLRARQAAIAAGEPDPLPLQPEDCAALFMCSLEREDDESSRYGQITCQNIFLAARAILQGTAKIASREEIEAGNARDRAAHAKYLAQEDRTAGRRTVRVEPLTPSTGKGK